MAVFVSALLVVQQAEAQALVFPITPCRLVDTRAGSSLQDGVPRTLHLDVYGYFAQAD
jgi:hypothetical protein